MLSEFAFTPAIFNQDIHDDKESWRDQLRELISTMFPRTSAWPVLVSDLYAGSWSSNIVPHIQAIQDHQAKKYCQDFLTQIKKMLVVRPECKNWPEDDDVMWCQEAVASNDLEPIDRIISVSATKDSWPQEFSSIRTIEEVKDAGFWRGIDSDASPRMIIDEQINLLRKLCLHSQWIALINPYGMGNEQEFSMKLLDFVIDRNKKFGPIHFELHAQAPDVTDPTEKQKRQDNVSKNIAQKVLRKLTPGNSIELYFWPRLLDRIILAGNYREIASGARRKSPRWGVSMSHVAHRSDPDAQPTEWKLLRTNSLDNWFRSYISEEVHSKPKPINISTASHS
jgi:hypothetical protein